VVLRLASRLRVPNASGDVWEFQVDGEVLFLFHTHPTVEISGKYMISMTMEVLLAMRGGSMENIVKVSIKVLDF